MAAGRSPSQEWPAKRSAAASSGRISARSRSLDSCRLSASTLTGQVSARELTINHRLLRPQAGQLVPLRGEKLNAELSLQDQANRLIAQLPLGRPLRGGASGEVSIECVNLDYWTRTEVDEPE